MVPLSEGKPVLREKKMSDGANPYAGLIADANGDLFGTT